MLTSSSGSNYDFRPAAKRPQTARLGWLIITRDRHIQGHARERAAVREYGGRMVALSGEDATDTWHQLEALLCRWRSIESLHGVPGPFIYALTRTALRRVTPGLSPWVWRRAGRWLGSAGGVLRWVNRLGGCGWRRGT
jgi:hypothetical protein